MLLPLRLQRVSEDPAAIPAGVAPSSSCRVCKLLGAGTVGLAGASAAGKSAPRLAPLLRSISCGWAGSWIAKGMAYRSLSAAGLSAD